MHDVYDFFARTIKFLILEPIKIKKKILYK